MARGGACGGGHGRSACTRNERRHVLGRRCCGPRTRCANQALRLFGREASRSKYIYRDTAFCVQDVHPKPMLHHVLAYINRVARPSQNCVGFINGLEFLVGTFLSLAPWTLKAVIASISPCYAVTLVANNCEVLNPVDEWQLYCAG